MDPAKRVKNDQNMWTNGKIVGFILEIRSCRNPLN